MGDIRVNEIKTDTIKDQTGTSALTVDTSGYLTASQPVLAHITMTSNQTNLTEQTWNKINFDSAIIDTKSGFDNANDRYTIPIAGYYRIYCQALMGVLGEQNSARDTGICISRTRSGTTTLIAISTNRHYDGGSTHQDTSDVTETVYVIDNCQAGDHIEFHSYMNTDTSSPYDVFADVDAGGENLHMNTNLPGGGSDGNPITYFTIERII